MAQFRNAPYICPTYITHNALDLYDVKISKYHGTKVNPVAQLENAYSDMLQKFFKDTTGLNTSL